MTWHSMTWHVIVCLTTIMHDAHVCLCIFVIQEQQQSSSYNNWFRKLGVDFWSIIEENTKHGMTSHNMKSDMTHHMSTIIMRLCHVLWWYRVRYEPFFNALFTKQMPTLSDHRRPIKTYTRVNLTYNTSYHIYTRWHMTQRISTYTCYNNSGMDTFFPLRSRPSQFPVPWSLLCQYLPDTLTIYIYMHAPADKTKEPLHLQQRSTLSHDDTYLMWQIVWRSALQNAYTHIFMFEADVIWDLGGTLNTY